MFTAAYYRVECTCTRYKHSILQDCEARGGWSVVGFERNQDRDFEFCPVRHASDDFRMEVPFLGFVLVYGNSQGCTGGGSDEGNSTLSGLGVGSFLIKMLDITIILGVLCGFWVAALI